MQRRVLEREELKAQETEKQTVSDTRIEPLQQQLRPAVVVQEVADGLLCVGKKDEGCPRTKCWLPPNHNACYGMIISDPGDCQNRVADFRYGNRQFTTVGANPELHWVVPRTTSNWFHGILAIVCRLKSA